MSEVQKQERYTMRQAAEDRVKELEAAGIRASFYHGHREFVVQYWVQA